jgi:thiamine pyrophosphokinase
MTAFTILLGGDISPTARLRQQVANTRVIAADSGMRHAPLLGLTPELWIGDFDSHDAELLTAYADVPRETYPANKDATDGDLAISTALSRGAEALIFVGALGGQFDHVICHAMMLQSIARREITCWMTSGTEEVYPLGPMTLKGHSKGTRLSIVPTTHLMGLTLDGVRWPLHNKKVLFGSSLTLSNEIETEASIRLISGEGYVIVYPKDIL